jgi:Zn-dependent protease
MEPVNEIDQLKRYQQKITQNAGQTNAETQRPYTPDAGVVKPKVKKGLWGTIGAFIAALFKFKPLLVLLKMGSFVSTLVSMLLMIVVYAKIFTWQFAIGFVLLLFVHEMGHYISAIFNYVNVSPPLFIPFVGALIRMKTQPQDAAAEARIAIAGPVLGSLGALLCLLIYDLTGQDIYLSLAYTGFLLNLLNLIPLYPLDGGRTVSAISPKLWLVGVPACVIILIFDFNPILLIVLLIGLLQLLNQRKNPKKAYYEIETSARVQFALLYFGLIIMLAIGMMYIHGLQAALIK